MFPQQSQPAFNPQQANQGFAEGVGNLAKTIGVGLASANPNPTFGAPTSRSLSGGFNPSAPINFNAISMGAVQKPSSFKIGVPQTIPSSALTFTGSPSSVMQARSFYDQANQSNKTNAAALTQAAPQPNALYNGNANIQTSTSAAPQGTQLPTDQSQQQIQQPPQQTQPSNPVAEYAKQVMTATNYDQSYRDALAAKNAADLREATLQSNLYSGNNLPGDTLGFAQGFTTREQALNNINQLAAAQNLNAAATYRQGSIEGAKAILDNATQTVSPGSSIINQYTGQPIYGGSGAYSDYQAQQTYFNLAQTYPDAQIPAYNQQLSAQQNLQVAQQAAQNSPSFQSRSTIPVTLPGGGYALVNKNQVAGYRPDGTAIIVSPAQAAQAQGAQQAIASLTKDKADTQAAINAADSNFPLLLQAVKSAGLNANAPLVNEIQQKIANKTSQSAAMAQLNTLVPSLQTEYSRIIARGGSVDDKTRSSAQAIINGTYTFNQLQAVYNTVQKEGANVVAGYDKEIQAQTNSLQSLYNTGSSSGSTGSTVSWDSL